MPDSDVDEIGEEEEEQAEEEEEEEEQTYKEEGEFEEEEEEEEAESPADQMDEAIDEENDLGASKGPTPKPSPDKDATPQEKPPSNAASAMAGAAPAVADGGAVPAAGGVLSVAAQIEQAVAAERGRWEKIVAASNDAGDATSQQVDELTRQLSEARAALLGGDPGKERDFEGRLTAKMREMEQLHASNLTSLKLEAIEREKAAVRRAREEGDASLMAEREASEEAMQHLGLEEEDRVRRKLKQAEKSWERQRTLLEGQAKEMQERLAAKEKELAGVDEDAANKAKEGLKRERARAKRIEKLLEAAQGEIAQLKTKMVENKQQEYQGSVASLGKESPEVAKLYKVIESYKTEARNLRTQMDAQRPDKLVEMQGDLRMKVDESDKLREEIRTLKQQIGRQERSIKESNVQDEDYASKVQGFLGDLQVAKEDCRRAKEKLEIADKALKSRQLMEEALRKKLEASDKKVKGLEARLKGKASDGKEDAAVAMAEQMRSELDGLQRRFLEERTARDGEKKASKQKLKDRAEAIQNLHSLVASKEAEHKKIEDEVREQVATIKGLRRELKERDGAASTSSNDKDKEREVIKEELRKVKQLSVDQNQTLMHAHQALEESREESAQLRIALENQEASIRSLQAARPGTGGGGGVVRGGPTSIVDLAEQVEPRTQSASRRPGSGIVKGRSDSRLGSARRGLRSRGQPGAAAINAGMEVLDAPQGFGVHVSKEAVADAVYFDEASVNFGDPDTPVKGGGRAGSLEAEGVEEDLLTTNTSLDLGAV